MCGPCPSLALVMLCLYWQCWQSLQEINWKSVMVSKLSWNHHLLGVCLPGIGSSCPFFKTNLSVNLCSLLKYCANNICGGAQKWAERPLDCRKWALTTQNFWESMPPDPLRGLCLWHFSRAYGHDGLSPTAQQPHLPNSWLHPCSYTAHAVVLTKMLSKPLCQNVLFSPYCH